MEIAALPSGGPLESRYAAVIFVVIGVYPMAFKLTGRLWDGRERASQRKNVDPEGK